MDPTRLAALERRVHGAYERGRARRALGVALLAAIPGIAAWLLGGGLRPLALAAAAYVAYALCLWRGQWLGRGARAGLLWGLVPFALAQLAQPLGGCHVGGACLSWCSIACSVGGLAVGGGVSWGASRAAAPVRFWVAGSSVALLAGATACRCAGVSSLLGMAIGLLVTTAPLAPRLLARRPAA